MDILEIIGLAGKLVLQLVGLANSPDTTDADVEQALLQHIRAQEDLIARSRLK